jgi:hypothetical protein
LLVFVFQTLRPATMHPRHTATHTLPPLPACPAAYLPSCSEREVQEGDDLVLLAAHALWALAFRTLTTTPSSGEGTTAAAVEPPAADPASLVAARALLSESLLLLEAALGLSAHNSQLRLAAARVCGWLGLAGAVIRHYPPLRMKHAALDSLAHPFIAQTSRLQAPEALVLMCESLHKWRG